MNLNWLCSYLIKHKKIFHQFFFNLEFNFNNYSTNFLLVHSYDKLTFPLYFNLRNTNFYFVKFFSTIYPVLILIQEVRLNESK